MGDGVENKEREPLITVKSLRKMYRMGSERVVALEDVNLTIGRGEVCCILGTSGSGKSTLLNMLAGLEKPTRGQVLIGKHDVAKMSESALAKFRQKYVGFVFQSYNLMGALTALENVSMPLMFRGMGTAKRNKMARQMLKNVGLGNRYDHKPTQMSGGQQQRVGIARAFVSRPRIVFADEPTGNLDSKTTIEVMELMVEMSHENDQTLILVTHNSEIAEYADRVITLIDGRIVSDIRQPAVPEANGRAVPEPKPEIAEVQAQATVPERTTAAGKPEIAEAQAQATAPVAEEPQKKAITALEAARLETLSQTQKTPENTEEKQV